ncbi:SpvB/TcaC N-terminal domain-containing protein [Rhodobacter lacus]|uniref:SpvB/TcaC N-terminal domain-containing protein n=2 Tax=Rhodobacter lacus TaxID=1641972 RepID=A0ABW5ACR0_9RHOB
MDLPKGGGALAGLDESLSVNALTGTASMAIPLPASPGRDGFGPQLQLRHDSGNGNSPFGLGWDCAPPAIGRRLRNRIPRYIDDGPEADAFEVSGGEELVAALSAQGGTWLPMVSVRSEAGVTYEVTRYRPRIEGAFTRIERWRRMDTGVLHWRSTDGANVTTVFGQDAACRLANPRAPQQVLSWLAERSYDPRGNLITYEYLPEDLTLVPDTAPERLRRDGRAPFAQRHLKRIRYGAHSPYQPGGALPEMLFELVFDYGDHAGLAPGPDPDQPWPVRNDPYSRHRAGFEQRCYRLCRRVLMFHRFAELGTAPCLVRALELSHDDSSGVSLLTRIVERGYIRAADGSYSHKETPPLSLRYSAPEWNGAVQQVRRDDLGPLPGPGSGARVQWADLQRCGLPGLLCETADGLSFRRNLGGGRLAAPVDLASQPGGGGLAQERISLDDPEGDTQLAYVLTAAGRPQGSWRVDPAGAIGAAPFQPLHTVAMAPPKSPVRRLDLTGAGRPDLLITEDDRLIWFAAQPGGGAAPGGAVARLLDEDLGPAVVLNARDEVILLANMTGADQLRDLVRVRQGEVCYWPNQGYARFGAKVTMSGAPLFDHPDTFDPARLLLADIDGTGAADLLYAGRDGIRLWRNPAGNGFLPPLTLPNPMPEHPGGAALVDLLGQGTACLIWTSDAPAHAETPLQYMDLMRGTVPNRLVGYDNGMGLSVALSYTPSTTFWREDQAAGRPWVGTLPFPVHCVSRVETRDAIAGTAFASRYRYSHGYYDPADREFRGFGRVDQIDQDRVTAYDTVPPGVLAAGATLSDLTQAPVETRSWYDLGLSVGRAEAMAAYRAEYAALALPEPEDLAPEAGLDRADWQAAHRACKGRPLRREIYGRDGSPAEALPYSVALSSGRVVAVQPRLGPAAAVLRLESAEEVTHHLERDPAQRRTEHSLTLSCNAFGQPLQVAKISYPRALPDAALPAAVRSAQAQIRIGLTETDYAAPLDLAAGYRMPQPCETRGYELTGLPAPATGLLRAASLRAHLAAAQTLLPEEAVPAAPARRLRSRSRSLSLADTLAGPLPLGTQGLRGLGHETYTQVFTPGLLSALYGPRLGASDLAAAGYVQFPDDSGWWRPGGRQTFAADAAQHFYRASGAIDGFGQISSVTWDRYSLLATETLTPAPVLNRQRAENDYRVLKPVVMTDANGNRTAVRFDELEIVVASAVMGKAGAAEGDTLAQPTVSISYDLFAWISAGKPTWARARTRTRHGAAAAPFQEIVSHLDGAGAVIMYKGQAEPGFAPQEQPDGTIRMVDTGAAPRWIGNGRVVRTNKGLPVLQYEPYFSATDAYESHPALVQMGVSPVHRYDALGRRIETRTPEGTLNRVRHGVWQTETHDPNDTVLESQWYAALGSPDPAGAAPAPPDRRAAWLAAQHAATPALTCHDPQGHEIAAIGDNGPRGKVVTCDEHEIDGSLSRAIDPLGRVAAHYLRDMTGTVCRQTMLDSGEKIQFSDIAGKPVLEWDEKGTLYSHRYDVLRRLTETWLTRPGAPAALVIAHVYGESRANPEADNLRGNKVATYDQAGLAEKLAFDFKNNCLHSRQTYAQNYRDLIDWNLPDRSILLEPDPWESRTRYDALDRAIEVFAPARTGETPARIVPEYTLSNLLAGLQVSIGGGALRRHLRGIDYDAKGQREAIRYGNGVETLYSYDPRSYRLTAMQSRRADGRVLQDLHFWRDPVGNITELHDQAQQTSYFNNAVVAPHARFAYDALYQLTDAWGREHIGQNLPPGPEDQARTGRVLPEDAAAMRRYHQSFSHDAAGNLTRVVHGATTGGWTRAFDLDPASNRLLRSRVGATTDTYGHGPQGAMRLPHLDAMEWDAFDRLRAVQRGTERVFYVYDYKGERVRKVVEKGAGLVEDRRLMGDYELFQRRSNGALREMSERLHITDDAGRIAIVERVLREAGADLAQPRLLERFQIGNHLGSAALELDGAGAVISYEEYHPFGTTAFQAGRSQAEVAAKTYRYIGAERDEESGLYHMGARYYAPWLGRFTAPDPAGHQGSANAYSYTENNPVNAADPTGLWSWRTVAVIGAAVVVGTVVTVATAGAAGPIVGTAAASIIGGAIGGAAGGAVAEVTDAKLSGRPVELGNVGRAAGTGLVVGAVVATGGVAIGAVAAGGGGAVGAALRTGATRVASTGIGRGVVSGAQLASRGASAVAKTRPAAAVGRALTAVARGSARAGEKAAMRLPGSAMRRAIARNETAAYTQAGQGEAAMASAQASQANLQNNAVERTLRLAAPDETFTHGVNWRSLGGGPGRDGSIATARIEAESALRVGTDPILNQWGPGVYAVEGGIPANAGPQMMQFRVPPGTAVENLAPVGQPQFVRLLPPPGNSHVPVTITGSNVDRTLVDLFAPIIRADATPLPFLYPTLPLPGPASGISIGVTNGLAAPVSPANDPTPPEIIYLRSHF